MSKLQPADAERRRADDLGRDHSEALARGLMIMAQFGEARRPQTISEIATAVGLPRATARRALLTLAALGYASLEGRHYSLTPRVLRLAVSYLTSNAISVLVQPACDRIASEVGESCTCAVLEGEEVVMIARALPVQIMPVGVGIGFRLPAYCSALGRVLLAQLSAAALETYLQHARFAPVTPFTLTRRDAIAAAIHTAREQGYCFVDQEAEHGFRSIAIPLRKFDGSIVAALNIGARVEQADFAKMLGPHLDVLQREASLLSESLI